MKIAIVSIPVRDQDAARRFYVEKLGFRVVSDEPMGSDRRWVLLAPPGGGASRVEPPDPIRARPPGTASRAIV